MKNAIFFKKALLLLLFIAFCIPVSACDIAQENSSSGFLSADDLDVPYEPTPIPVVEEMLKLAEVTKGDVVYDLGCGDGRIVVTAAKNYGVTAVGVDLDPQRVLESENNVRLNGVENLVTIKHQNIFETDVSEASVVMLYLYPSVNLALKPVLLNQLKPGSRVVSHAFDMGDWEPERKVIVEHEGAPYIIYLWRIPEKRS
jgi:SAM-dependent methyltransferase